MMLSKIIEALIIAEAAPKAILAAVTAFELEQENKKNDRRRKDAERKQMSRMSRGHAVTSCDSADSPTPPLVPPSDGFPDPSLTPPYNPPVTPMPAQIEKLKKGKRLPSDWELPQEWGEWAEALGMDEKSINHEAEKFKDYWHARAGPGAVKVDWEATWRNWIRSNLEGKNSGIQSKKFG